jgi:hypothetical protein
MAQNAVPRLAELSTPVEDRTDFTGDKDEPSLTDYQ